MARFEVNRKIAELVFNLGYEEIFAIARKNPGEFQQFSFFMCYGMVDSKSGVNRLVLRVQLTDDRFQRVRVSEILDIRRSGKKISAKLGAVTENLD